MVLEKESQGIKGARARDLSTETENSKWEELADKR